MGVFVDSVRVPLGSQGVVLKAREPWPRTSKVSAIAPTTILASRHVF